MDSKVSATLTTYLYSEHSMELHELLRTGQRLFMLEKRVPPNLVPNPRKRLPANLNSCDVGLKKKGCLPAEGLKEVATKTPQQVCASSIVDIDSEGGRSVSLLQVVL